jgi:hypothetical protein
MVACCLSIFLRRQLLWQEHANPSIDKLSTASLFGAVLAGDFLHEVFAPF